MKLCGNFILAYGHNSDQGRKNSNLVVQAVYHLKFGHIGLTTGISNFGIQKFRAFSLNIYLKVS